MGAVKSGDTKLVRAMLAVNASLGRAKDDEGATPLHYATLGGQREIVALLLENGADINARDDEFGATPTGWAIEYLREAGGLLAMEIEDLLLAIGEQDVHWVSRFLRRLPALATARDSQGKALSQHAAESPNEEIRRLFGDRHEEG
jgi:hypothetical protein